MSRELLNGKWQRRIGKGDFSEINVPFSTLPVGHSECVKTFDLKEKGDTVLLKFNGITYYAEVTLNGVYLGDMLPYSEYVFDITETVKEKGNVLSVEIEDIAPKFGPSEGWENYSGIIRDVSLIYKNKNYIEDIFFKSELTDGYKNALYCTEVKAKNPENAQWKITLLFNGEEVDCYSFKDGEEVKREVKNINLWSPDQPNLYLLKAELFENGQKADEYICNVGFREFKCNRHRFTLNGKELFLQGVCKHEMVADSGHVPTVERIEADLKMIKDTGCNFVRLVHYPHCKATLDIADRLGLMVSEEPGLWWSDTSDPEISGGSIGVLRRTIMRDRNHPSIIFWLSFNECRFTEQFLLDSARACKELDPTRLVSGANCMSNEDTLKYYNLCGFDFYTMHPYSDTFTRSLKSAVVLNDKPLMFTEWGGYFVYDNPHLLTDFMNGMYSLYEKNSDEGALAGASIWYWAELNDFNRGRPACIDGALKEALVDKYRNPTMIYKPFCDAIKNAGKVITEEEKYEFNPLSEISGTPMVCENSGDFETVKEALSENVPIYHSSSRKRRIKVGAVLGKEEVKGILKAPAVISSENSPSFKGGKKTDTVTVLGCVSAPYGYPLAGEYGEKAAEITVDFSDGEKQSFPLRNGMEITTVHTTLSSSRINPVAENAKEFARFSYDKNHENYIINRLDLKLDGRKTVETVEFKSINENYKILIYGVYLKK